jgi:hypothetical protein
MNYLIPILILGTIAQGIQNYEDSDSSYDTPDLQNYVTPATQSRRWREERWIYRHNHQWDKKKKKQHGNKNRKPNQWNKPRVRKWPKKHPWPQDKYQEPRTNDGYGNRPWPNPDVIALPPRPPVQNRDGTTTQKGGGVFVIPKQQKQSPDIITPERRKEIAREQQPAGQSPDIITPDKQVEIANQKFEDDDLSQYFDEEDEMYDELEE